jgi:hypothetical protein
MPNYLTVEVLYCLEKSGFLSASSVSTFVSHGKKMDEQECWAREKEEWTMRRKVEEEGCKIKGQAGWQWQWGTSCSASLGVVVREEDMFVANSHRKKMEER